MMCTFNSSFIGTRDNQEDYYEQRQKATCS